MDAFLLKTCIAAVNQRYTPVVLHGGLTQFQFRLFMVKCVSNYLITFLITFDAYDNIANLHPTLIHKLVFTDSNFHTNSE